MTTNGITAKQAGKIYEALLPTLGFLTQVEVRLGEMGVSPLDPYFQKVVAARDAFHGLTVETHSRSCEGGGEVGRGAVTRSGTFSRGIRSHSRRTTM